ncbi:DUF4097 family beta strand repeat-containing protein [Limibacter armeniacum]|uniref:DUF4097 family beta strand repeat-containing protein n=1 Tax=Limibacter armeniacum TaxID=466084 RepID=UPI002FE6BF0B
MKRSTYKLYLLLLIGLLTFNIPVWAQEEASREFEDTYKVNSDEKLSLHNKFGTVFIETSATNSIIVKVEIKAWAKNEEKAQSILDMIKIKKDHTGGVIFYETSPPDNNWSNNNKGFEINYYVKMPKGNPLDVSNKYGNVELGDFNGKLELDVAYGQLRAQRIESPIADIKLSYSGGEIESIKRGDMRTRYCSTIKIEEVGDLQMDDKYGGIAIERAGQVRGSSSYASLSIGNLQTLLELESKYGSVKVDDTHKSFSGIMVDSSYGSVKLGFEDSSNFDFEVHTRYGGFSSKLDGVDIYKEITRNTSGDYEGRKGSEGSGKKVTVYANYGSVTFR